LEWRFCTSPFSDLVFPSPLLSNQDDVVSPPLFCLPSVAAWCTFFALVFLCRFYTKLTEGVGIAVAQHIQLSTFPPPSRSGPVCPILLVLYPESILELQSNDLITVSRVTVSFLLPSLGECYRFFLRLVTLRPPSLDDCPSSGSFFVVDYFLTPMFVSSCNSREV